MRERITAMLLAAGMVFTMAGCAGGGDAKEDNKSDDKKAESLADSGDGEGTQETEIQVFIAASLNTVMTELAGMYNREHPEVKITYNSDSSGTLLTQIEEGYECDGPGFL